MLLMTTIDMLSELTEGDVKVLAGYTIKDRIIIFSEMGATMPVALFQTLAGLKCRLDIIETKLDDLFQLGYTFGFHAASAKAGEQVTILMKNPISPAAGGTIVCTSSLTGGKSKKAAKPAAKAPAKTTENKSVPAAEPQQSSEITPDIKPMKKSGAAESIAVTESEKKPAAKKSVSRRKKIKNVAELVALYPGLKPIKSMLLKNEEALRDAIVNSSDANIGFKFQLEVRFSSDGTIIWEALKDDFEKIKKDFQEEI